MTLKSFPAANRKDAHIDLALDLMTNTDNSNSFDRMDFVHCALPEVNLASIDLSTEFLGRHLSAPMIIGAMTGGTPRAEAINQALAMVAQDKKIAFAVGSQRAAIESKQTAADLRNLAPNIPIISNLGGIQLARSNGLDFAKEAIEDLQADAIAIHLNPLQEAIQPEGECDWRGVRKAIAALVRTDLAPVIVKEVGAGISAGIAKDLFDCGVAAVDIAGFGGTNWARIEANRRVDDIATFEPFLDWGMPTVECLINACNACPNNLIIASGGVRHGLDAMRAYRLGADIISLAGPMLKQLLISNKKPSVKRLGAFVDQLKQQMNLTLFLTGAQNLCVFREKAALIDNTPL